MNLLPRQAVLLAAILLMALSPNCGAQPVRKNGKNMPLGKLALTTDAVPISGRVPTPVVEADSGDLIQVLISYPMAPPFPKSATIIVPVVAPLRPVGIYRTQNRVAVLTTEPQTGLIGLGYLGAFLKAVRPGKGSFQIVITMSDGAKTEIPFSVSIKE